MIHLECDNDEAVVRGLGFSRKEITHHAGKPRVSFALQKANGPNAIGLVDQDPGSSNPPYLLEFRVFEDEPSLGLRRLQHPREGKWLIEIQPDLEPWIYASAKSGGVDPEDHHLPAKLTALHDHPKQYSRRLSEFIATLKTSGCPRMKKLAQWLRL